MWLEIRHTPEGKFVLGVYDPDCNWVDLWSYDSIEIAQARKKRLEKMLWNHLMFFLAAAKAVN